MHSQTGCAHFVPTSAIGQPPFGHSTPRARRPQAKIRCWFLGLVLVVGGTPAAISAQETRPPGDLANTLALVGQRVESWYRRAQSVVSRETVLIQPLRSDSTPNEIPRRLVFELRVGWEADPEKPDGPLVASVLRQPVDSFFEHVLVNDEDVAVRANRLALLARIRAATGQVADFSKIAG